MLLLILIVSTLCTWSETCLASKRFNVEKSAKIKRIVCAERPEASAHDPSSSLPQTCESGGDKDPPIVTYYQTFG